MVYDYEPFCSDGFEINVVISSVSLSNVGFIKYLYTKKRKLIDYLKEKYVNKASKKFKTCKVLACHSCDYKPR